MSLGQKIKQLRQERHWTQAELAALAGVSRSYISKLEREINMAVSVDYLAKLARGVGIDLQILLAAVGLRTPIPGEAQPVSNAINNPELRQWVTFQNLNNLSESAQRIIVSVIQIDLEFYPKSQRKCQDCWIDLTKVC